MKPADRTGGPPMPVPGQWVVLHRVGSDRAAPVDSTKSGANGNFRISYRPFGADDALYFVSSRYQGIMYFSPPLRADTVRGGDADVIVYETSSDTAQLRVSGRHFVMSMARGSPARRQIVEIFELDNQGTQTIVARDPTTPLWTTLLPQEAESASVAPGDVGAGAVVFRRGRAELFAPIAPGVRQLVLTYSLPSSAFPVARPLERQASVLEVLLEEPRAQVEGAKLAEVAAASIEGRTFRRFLAQDIPASAVLRVTAPPSIAENQRTLRILAGVLAAAMLAALGAWLVRARGRRRAASGWPHVREAASEVDLLVAELAALDASFERETAEGTAATDDQRAAYQRDRASLRDRIARALAAEPPAV